MNWVDKSANLLVEECELEPGEGFDLQAPTLAHYCSGA